VSVTAVLLSDLRYVYGAVSSNGNPVAVRVRGNDERKRSFFAREHIPDERLHRLMRVGVCKIHLVPFKGDQVRLIDRLLREVFEILTVCGGLREQRRSLGWVLELPRDLVPDVEVERLDDEIRYEWFGFRKRESEEIVVFHIPQKRGHGNIRMKIVPGDGCSRTVVIEDVIAEGDKVMMRYRIEGTHEGELFGVPPTGRRVSIESITVERVSGGKIREHWRVTDTLDMMQQLGAIPAPEIVAGQ